MASARQAVDSLRLYAAQLPLRLSPQLQEVKGQLLAQTGQPPRLGPPSVVALMAGRDRGAELKASSASRGGGRNKNSPPSSGSSGVYKRDVGASCDVIQAAHWEQTSGNSISHKNPRQKSRHVVSPQTVAQHQFSPFTGSITFEINVLIQLFWGFFLEVMSLAGLRWADFPWIKLFHSYFFIHTTLMPVPLCFQQLFAFVCLHRPHHYRSPSSSASATSLVFLTFLSLAVRHSNTLAKR